MTILALALIGIGVVFVLLNWICFITSLVTKKFHSMVPPLGGLLILIGLLFTPNWRHLAWVGLLMDPGFLAFMYCLPEFIRQFRRSSKSRLKLSLSGRSEDLEVQLLLFQPDYYEIKLTRMPQSRSSLGNWRRDDDHIELISHTDKPERPSRAVLTRSLDQDHYEVTKSTFAVSDLHDTPELPPVSFRLAIDQSNLPPLNHLANEVSMTETDIAEIEARLDIRLPSDYRQFMLSANPPSITGMLTGKEQIIAINQRNRQMSWLGRPLDRVFYIFATDERGREIVMDLDIPEPVIMAADYENQRGRILARSFRDWLSKRQSTTQHEGT